MMKPPKQPAAKCVDSVLESRLNIVINHYTRISAKWQTGQDSSPVTPVTFLSVFRLIK